MEYFFLASFSFSEKNATSLPSWLKTTPITRLLASVSTVKTLLKLGRVSIGYCATLDLRYSKASLAYFVHTNLTFLPPLIVSSIGAHTWDKVFQKFPIKYG